MKNVIGIISCLPDNNEIRAARIDKLVELIKQCSDLFELPIIIVAQNWGNFSLSNVNSCSLIIDSHKEKLGITGARRRLRELFINSEYDNLIMLDDDSKLLGDKKSAQEYLKQIELHPNSWSETKTNLLKLFVISKEIYKQINFPSGGADSEICEFRYFEDMWLIGVLKKLFKDRHFSSNVTNLREISDAAWDKLSTWHDEVYNGKWTRHDTGNLTRGLIDQATKENLLNTTLLKRGERITLQGERLEPMKIKSDSNICIGIISYLPDDIRDIRFSRLKNLVYRLKELTNLPIIIIAQNWTDENINELDCLTTIYQYDKLGITKARETLRRIFISSEYTGIICFDDDFEPTTNKRNWDVYLNYIRTHNSSIIEYDNYLMNLLYMPKSIFKLEPFDLSVSAEKNTGYEDWCFVSIIKRKYPNRYLKLKDCGLSVKTRHEMCNEANSTWRNGKEKDQTEISRKIINNKLERL